MKRATLLAGLVGLVVALGPGLAAADEADGGGVDPATMDGGTADAGSPVNAGSADAGSPVNAGSADAGPPVNAGSANAGPSGSVTATCVEHVPPGAKRPIVKEEIIPRSLSGYAVELHVTILHGKGERVLPEGFHLGAGSDATKALESAGFALPDPAGGAAPRITTTPTSDTTATTTIVIPLVALPPKPGRQLLEVPPLPIAIARANNDYVTLCTSPHALQVDDPIANELDPRVKPNPPGRPQKEDWPLARWLAIGIPAAIAIAVAAALLDRWWRRRPKPVPVAPKIPPWVVAVRELERIRRSTLLADGKRGEHFDQVSDVVRAYLGARYGFEAVSEGGGLETTTGEMLEILGRVRPPIAELPRIKEFLEDCDLVKFARFTPDAEHCLDSLVKGEVIVQRTIPVMQLGPGGPSSSQDPPKEGP